VNSIRIDSERSSGLLKGVALGLVAPGVTATKTIHLFNAGAPGPRVLDISIQSTDPATRAAGAAPSTPLTPARGDMAETLQTLSIPTVAPVTVAHDVRYMRSCAPMAPLTDLRAYEGDYWDESVGGEAVVGLRMTCAGPHAIGVETVRLVRKVCCVSGGVWLSRCADVGT
jgi:hypothetical protein